MKPFRTFRDRVKPEKKLYARAMRESPTVPEEMLWKELRGKKLGAKFRRQSIILGWIVDFYCPSHNLVVEIDGLYHHLPKNKVHDKKRSDVMLANGFRTLRIDNSDVENNLPLVLDKIQIALSKSI